MNKLELAKTHFLEGLKFFDAGDLESAESKFRDALNLTPDRVSVLTNLAATLIRKNQVPEASELAAKAVAIDTKAHEAWMILGICRHRESNFTKALELYDRALLIKPDHAETWSNRGAAFLGLKRHGDALACYQKALGIAPRNAAAWCNQGVALQELKRYEEALHCYDKALAISQQYAEAWCNRGNSLYELNRHEEALASLDKALSIKPDYADAWLSRGVNLQKLWRHREALESFDKALGYQPDNARAWERKGVTLQILKRYGEAFEALDRAVALEPDSPQAWVNRGNTLQPLDRHDEALASYDKAIELDPKLAEAWSARVSLQISDVNNVERAMEESRKSLQVYLNGVFNAIRANPAGSTLQRFRVKHDLEQARFLKARSHQVNGLDDFLEVSQELLEANARQGHQDVISPTSKQMLAMAPYLETPLLFQMPTIRSSCVNPDNDWKAIEEAYLAGSPEIIHIDNFLSAEALAAFQEYALVSKVWLVEYNNKYLGAFANKGFISPLHLRLAKELQQVMPRVFKSHRLSHLWGFKYDSTLGKGINVHADFAQVNLNFWITPDEYNLDPDSGGLKVYDAPSPPDWPFFDYNENKKKIYAFLEEKRSKCVTVPHRCNRAVLFNSALFHETDKIHFKDGYESRRINFTYLFGWQL